MLTADLTQRVMSLDDGDRAELVGLLIDSLEDDHDDETDDSVTIAQRRSVEMKSGEDPGMTIEELMASVRADRVRKNEPPAAHPHASRDSASGGLA